MKTLPIRSHAQSGSVLLLSLAIAGILGLTLASYLLMARQQHVSVARSQVWNSAIVMTEAGVEDALALLNKYSGEVGELTNWSTSASLAEDNWATLAANVFHVRRYVGESFYDVYITNLNNNVTPVIKSIGYAPWYYSSKAAPTYYATVNNPAESTGPKMLNRNVGVLTRMDPLFNVAMAAIYQIDFNGKNVQTDSFDSSNPLYSTNGMYPYGMPSMQRDNGDVVTDYSIINALNVGNARIKGRAKTGPNGSVYVGPNGAVGSKAWVEGGNTGIQPGYASDDMNVLFPSVKLPESTGWVPLPKQNPAVTIGGVAYDYVIPDGDWWLDKLILKTYVSGNARLHVTDTVNMTGQDVLRIAATGASLKLYVSASTASIAGNGVINESGNANNFIYFGLPSNKSLSFGGNANFIGCIYAPDTNFSLGGGGSDTYDFVGASVTRTVRMNGHFNFHYDEALRNNGMGRGYIPTSWKES